MIWKTTLAFLVSIKKNQNLKNSGLATIFLLAAFFAPVQSALSQSSVNCNIDVVGCPPTDIVETCGNETVNSILGNYVGWTEPDYSLDCGAENGYQYEISFDLPESKEGCWSFSKVQRVGNNGGTLQLWQSTGTTTNPTVTSPSFYIDEVMQGSLDILAKSSENFKVNIYLLYEKKNPSGTFQTITSGILDTFTVTGDNSSKTYPFSVDPKFFDGSGNFDKKVFRLKFEFISLISGNISNKNFVELIKFDAGLFGEACAAEANFAVVSTHKPGDFFPTGTTTVTYTATCNGCSPVISETCSFNVVVNAMPSIPVAAETVQPTCENPKGSIKIAQVTIKLDNGQTEIVNLQYSINGGTFSSTKEFPNLNPGTYSIIAKNSSGCESEPLLIVLNNQPQTPAAPVASVSLQPGCDSETGTISVSNIIANATYTLVNNDGTFTPYIFTNGSFSGLAGGTYKVKVSNGSCQSTSEALTIVAFQDTEAPVANVAELPSVTGECTATITAAPTATDNCSGTITATTTDALTYTAQGNHTVTWTYTDAKGNTSTQEQTVIVDDVTAPVADVATLPTVTGECSATVASAPTATDNCGATITATTTDALNYTAQGTYTITWTYDDGNGNTSTQEQTVIVDDVTAPVANVATIPTVTGECSATVASAPTATDNCGGTITATTTDALNYTAQGTYTITWTFNDGNGNTSTQEQTVIVDDVTAPVANDATLPTVTGECSATVASAPTATDNCGATITATTTDALTYTAQGTYIIIWTYNDGNGNTSTQEQTVIVDDVTAPVANVAELPTVTGECSATVASAPTATDNCGGTITATTTDALNYTSQGTYTVTWTYNDGNGNISTQTQTVIVDDVTAPVANVSDLPTVTGECSATVASAPTATDNCGGTMTATTEDALTYTAQGTYTITWNYNDGNGNTSTQTQTVIVDDVTAPVANITNLPAISGGCSVEVTGFPTATDNCGGTITATTEDELTFTEQGTYTITWTYNDGNGNTSSQTQTVVVSDTAAPVADLSNLPILRGECSVTVETIPTATDNCSGEKFEATTEDALTYNEQGTYTITWTYNDGNGNVSTQEQTVIVDDVTAPVADVAELPTVTGQCSATVASAPTATDNCGGTITATTTDALNYTAQGTYTITWTYNDGNGNTSTQEQIVIVDDVTAPVADVAELSTVTGECSATVASAPTATDNCGGTITATTEDALTYDKQGTYIITWTYDDGNGNTATQEQTVIVDDITAPVANVSELPTVTGECSATVASAPTATDNCGGTITGTTEDALTYTAQGTYTITWTYDDGNGNTSTQEQTVIVDDVTAPLADVTELPTVTGECSATVASAPTATDNCGATITATTEDELTYTEQGTYTITWTYNDGNGNTSTQTQTVIVDDVTAPVADIAELPTITGGCSVEVTQVPTATDNCGATITATTEDALSYTEPGTYTITWTYDDGNGNTSTQTQTVIVDDVTAPVADVAELPTVTGECSATVAAVPTATDNCGGTITATTEDALTYSGQGTYTITWTYGDGNGNASTQTQTVIVDDVTTPVANDATLPTVTGECSATVASAPTATDNCGGTITATTTDALTYPEQGTYTITWTYDDGNGNTSTQEQTVIVDDVTAPVANVAELPTVTGECSATVASAPTATDNCGGTITATTTDALTYPEQGTYTITWTYNDGNGNTSTQTQTIIVDDVTAPVANVATLPTVTGECSATVASAPTATDNCGGTITATTTDALTYTAQGTYTITWTYNDGNGNTSTQTQTVIVDDVTAPVANVAELPTVTGECSATVASAPTATDNCGGTITATNEDALTYNEQGTYTITWTYNDGNGNTSTQTQIVIVDDVTAPVADVAELPTVTVECSATVASAPTATDNCGGTITATTEDALTYTAQGTYTITWTYDDGNGNTSTQTQTVIVDDVTAPVADVAELPTVTGECSATVASAPTATDNCGGTITATTEDALTYDEQGTHTITWTYDDGNGNTFTQTQIVIVDDVTAPVANVATLPTVTGECSATVASAPTATDNCGGTITATTEDALTYTAQGTYTVTWTYNDGNGNTSTQTQTVIVDDVTAPVADVAELPTVTGECSATVASAPTATDNCGSTITATTEDTLTYNEQGTYTITWTYNDGNGNTSTQTQIVIVDDTAAPTPDMASLPTLTAECSVTINVIPTATDNCSGEMFEATTNDPLNYSEQGTYTITWTYDDGNGNTSTQTQTVIVDDVTAPVADVAELPTVTGECSATVAAVPTATDNCGGTITATTEDALTYSGQGTYTITWTYDDGNGNTSTQEQTVIVDDVTAPVANVAELPTVTGECSATVASAPTATDNCGGTITATTTDALTYNEQGTYTITWTFDDGNGNTSSQTQTVIVDDVTAPVADVATLPTVTGECSATVASAPTATDNCGATITATTEDALTYNEQGTYTITWTFDDGNGNTSSQTQTVIVDDVTAPVADVTELPTVTGECSATVASAPTATDNCGGTITATTEDALTYNEQGTYTITWTYNDGNGNTSTQTQTVIVDDVTTPVANDATLPTVTGECSATVASAPTATDNCGAIITATTEDALTYNEQGTYTITWTYNDGNGNTSTQTQIVIVDDVTAPVANVATLPTVTGECSATVASAPTATDNCGATITATTEDALTYSEQGTFTITWTYSDGNGNISTQSQTVIVDDITAPVADIAELPTVTGECSATVASAPTATDNCGGTITATTEDALTYDEPGTYTITWIFNDGNGNTTTQTQTVTVTSISAPQIASTTQPTCDLATGSFTVVTVAGLEYSIDGENYSANGTFENLAPGVYFVAAMNAAGCMSPLTEVEINEANGLTAPQVAGTVQPTCTTSTGSFTVVTVDGVSYSINGTDFQTEAEFTTLAPGTYNLTARNEAGCVSPAVVVTINESQSTAVIETTTIDLCTEDSTYDLFDLLVGEYDETGTWSDPDQTGALTASSIDPSLLPVGQYTFNYVIGGDCPSTTTVEVSINDDCVVLPCDFADIKNGISKAVTPNGDTFNDTFIVDEERACGFSYNLKIFNRWGAEVFAINNYMNNWDGQSNKSVSSSNQLPSGTYFYIIEINGSGFEPIQGYIYLGTK